MTHLSGATRDICCYCGRPWIGPLCKGCGAGKHGSVPEKDWGERGSPWFLNGYIGFTESNVLADSRRIHFYQGSEYICTLNFTHEAIMRGVPEGSDGLAFVWAALCSALDGEVQVISVKEYDIWIEARRAA